jgi:hyperosmotically inducible periplasmic protein
MFKKILKRFSGAAVFILVVSMVQVGMASISKGTATSARNMNPKEMQDRVQRTLLMLPTYGVFDELSFAVQGDKVILTGEVRKPILKSEAEAAVRKISGVASVINNVQILPLSQTDDALRVATYRAVYSQPGFERYDIQAFKPIKIIVKNSHITLDGVVGAEIDKILAEKAARNVPFAFSVTNNLTID